MVVNCHEEVGLETSRLYVGRGCCVRGSAFVYCDTPDRYLRAG